jgi:hypothetical protein
MFFLNILKIVLYTEIILTTKIDIVENKVEGMKGKPI